MGVKPGMMAAALALLTGCTTATVGTARLAALANPSRPASDTARDGKQKASELMAFAGIAPGQTVADMLPGGGYWTRLFSQVVGPRGKVFAVLARPSADAPASTNPIPAKAIAAGPAFHNVTAIESSFTMMSLPAKVDLFWTSRNYRDFYRQGRETARAISKAIYDNMKPGGLLVIVDHAASPQMALADQTKLGRIDPAVVKADVVAAGFLFAGESDVLANPADDHLRIIIDPAIMDHTDQFVFKFRKPR
ncbi:class I SAM-dependent methyltransferase [Sphingomonas oligophenolica]|uniref:Methyltransferase n=1 Tax=Sphingomonas oligophenolica TaxID=301154 RepID=A0ABU9Y658_9SPHN